MDRGETVHLLACLPTNHLDLHGHIYTPLQGKYLFMMMEYGIYIPLLDTFVIFPFFQFVIRSIQICLVALKCVLYPSTEKQITNFHFCFF